MKKTTHMFCLAVLVISLSALSGMAEVDGGANDKSRKSARLHDLTRSVAERIGRGDTRVSSLVKERYQLMKELAETDPKAVLQGALSLDTLSRAPEASRKYLETRDTVEGELEVMAECEEHDGRIEYFVTQGDRRFQLHLAGEPDDRFATGKQISVDAVKLDDILVADSDSMKSDEAPSETFTKSALANTTGEKRVLVILVNFQDKQTQPFTVEQARDVTFNQTSNFIRENSYGQTWLTGDVSGWYTIPMSSSVCDTMAIATYAKQAAANAGANLASYTNFIYGFPSNSACTFTGLATIGGSQPQMWVNDWYRLAIVGHEFGHNLGLFHSRSMDCGSVSVGGACTTSEYGDVFDVMGGGDSPHYNLFQKERLGWINSGASPPLQTVSASGVYWIDSYVPPGANSKGLKVLKSVDPATGSRTWYFIERRTSVGFDGYLSNIPSLSNGVLVHIGSDTSFRENYLLDMTPATTSWFDAALRTGQSFSDPNGGPVFTVLSADSSGAWVRVETAAQACVRANPTVSATPGVSPSLQAGSAFAYQVSVWNNNSGGCLNETFNLSSILPSGFTSSLAVGSVSLANGGSASVQFSAVSPASALGGAYDLRVTASNSVNSGYAGTGSATYVVSAAPATLNVSATPGAPKYSRSQTAKVTSAVSVAGTPVTGAMVTFTLRKSNGSTVQYAVQSGSDGLAVFSYKFNRKLDPTGTYSVSVFAETKELSGQASTSFLVTK